MSKKDEMIEKENISVEQYLNTIDAYNKLIEKINKIEKETTYITLARKIRYIIYEIFIDIIGIYTLLNILFGLLFGTTFRDVIINIYSYIMGLFC